MNYTVDSKDALVQGGARELTSEEIDLVSGGDRHEDAVVQRLLRPSMVPLQHVFDVAWDYLFG